MPIETQADRRRAQLIRIAAALIDTEGVDALNMSRVGELAGCTRTQVHRYFARREDLISAVVYEFNKVLSAKLESVGVLLGPGSVGDDVQAWSTRVHEAIWDLFDEGGMAGLILLAVPHASSGTRAEIDKLRHELFAPWVENIANAFASKQNAELVVDLWMVTAYRLATKWRAGELDRETAIASLTKTQLAILGAFARRD